MATITAAQQTQILKIVAGMFNAAPGATYLTEFSNFIAAGGSMLQLATNLANTDAYVNGIMGGKATVAAQTAELMSHFGLTYGATDAASVAAQAWFTGQISANRPTGEMILEAVTALSDPAWLAANPTYASVALLLSNKAAVAEYHATDLNASSTSLSVLQSVLAAVDANTDVSTDAAIEAAIAAGQPDELFTLEAGVVDTINMSINDITVGNEDSLDTGDAIFGNGTLEIDLTGPVNMSGQIVNGASLVAINATGGVTLRTSDWTNIGRIDIDNSTGSVTLNDLQDATVDVHVDDLVDATATVTLNYDAQAVASTTTDVVVGVSEMTAGLAVTGGNIEEVTLEIEDRAGAVSTLAALTATNISTLEINGGTAGLNFGITAALDAGLDTIAAGDAASNLSLNASASTENMNITLGTGNDRLSMGNGYATGDTVNGGNGDDMVAVLFTSAGNRAATMSNVETLNAVFDGAAEFDGTNVTGLKTINLGLEFNGTTTNASAADADFNQMKAETNTVNVHASQMDVELDYVSGANTPLVMNIETDAAAITMGQDAASALRLINVGSLTLTNTGDNVFTAANGVMLDNTDTTALTIATTEQGGDIVIGDANGIVVAVDGTNAVEEVRIAAVAGDISVFADQADPDNLLDADEDFMDDNAALQNITVTTNDAFVRIGRIGNVTAADELENITVTANDDGSVAMGNINAAGASINSVVMTTSDSNTIDALAGFAGGVAAGIGTQNNLNIFVDGITSTTLNDMTLNANDRGNIEIDGLSTILGSYTLTGTGNVFVNAGATALIMNQFGTATDFSGLLTLTDGGGADTLRGTGDGDRIVVSNADAALDRVFGGDGNDTIDVLATATGAVTMDGGAGDDTINIAAAVATTTNTSAGNDTINLNIAGGADADTIRFTNAQVTGGGVTTIDGSIGFETGTDILNFNGIVPGIATPTKTTVAAGVPELSLDDNAVYLVGNASTAMNGQTIASLTDLSDVASFINATVSGVTNAGAESIFVIHAAAAQALGGAMDVGIYLFRDNGAVAGVQSDEVTLIGLMDVATAIAAGDIA